MKFYLGLDLGQAHDWTAIAILERIVRREEVEREGREPSGLLVRWREMQALPAEYQCRHLERPKLGTPYPAIVSRVAELLATPALRGQTRLVVDATGVGRPVVDMLKTARLDPVPITIHGGDAVTPDRSGFRVPKRDLVGVVQVLLQSERLKIARELPLATLLEEELRNFRVTINATTAHDSFNAREGAHDDLVLALAVAAWYAERPKSNIPHYLSSSSQNLYGLTIPR